MVFTPRLVVKSDNEGNVLLVEMFVNDNIVNCFDAFTGTLLNQTPHEIWDEVGDSVRTNVMTYINKLVLAEAD